MSTRPAGVPAFDRIDFQPRQHPYCVLIPVLNEGERIRAQLQAMQPLSQQVDIILIDGGSTDGALDHAFLKNTQVRSLLVKTGPGRLGAQQRIGFWVALEEGYAGAITLDGNGKDDPAAIPAFVEQLEAGHDFVQGSRYLPGGQAIRTPLLRHLAIRLVHAPLISWLAGFHYTDTTNGFRGHSRALLSDPRVAPLRDVFDSYELLAYLSVRAPRLGFRTRELPVTRAYPAGEVPTKIHGWQGNWLLLHILYRLARGAYDPD